MADHLQYLHDASRVLTASELCKHHAHNLPLLVIVSRGFYSNKEEMSFSTGQVVRLQELRQHRRALVHDEQKKTLSIPLDYSHRFHVGHDHSKALTMQEIVERNDLPVKVKFADPRMRFTCGPEHTTRSLGTLKVVRQHEETFFLANTVVQGRLLDTVIAIPLYLKDVTFCVVTGVRGRGLTDGGRGHMQSLLHAQAQVIDFSTGLGDTEMVQLSEKPIKATDNIYQNIDTNIYINVQQHRQQLEQQQERQQPQPERPRDGHHQQLQRPRRAPPSPPTSKWESVTMSTGAARSAEGEYTNCGMWQRNRTSEWPPLVGENYVYDGADDSVYEPVGENSRSRIQRLYTALRPESSPPPPSPPSGQGPPAGSSFEDELQRELKRRQIAASRHQTHPATRHDRPPDKKDPPGNSQEERALFAVRLRPTQQRVPASAEPGSSRPDPDPAPVSTADTALTPQKPAVKKKPAGLKGNAGVRSVAPSNAGLEHGAQPRVTQQAPTADREGSKVTPVPPRAVLQPATSPASPQGGASGQDVIYVNQLQMAVIPPTRSSGPSRSGPAHGGEGPARGRGGVGEGGSAPALQAPSPPPGPPDTSSIKPPPSLPVDQPLDLWTIQHVQHVLQELNLARYGPVFREHLIDGHLLPQLTGDVLRAEFSMSAVEVIRLQTFVKTGHLPK